LKKKDSKEGKLSNGARLKEGEVYRGKRRYHMKGSGGKRAWGEKKGKRKVDRRGRGNCGNGDILKEGGKGGGMKKKTIRRKGSCQKKSQKGGKVWGKALSGQKTENRRRDLAAPKGEGETRRGEGRSIRRGLRKIWWKVTSGLKEEGARY